MNVAGIVGAAAALHLTQDALDIDRPRIAALALRLRERLLASIPDAVLNGHPEQRLANNVSMSFDGADARDLLGDLDDANIACSAGAACGATTLEPSHVLLALGVPLKRAVSTLRFSVGHDTTNADIDYVIETLPPIVARSRAKRMTATRIAAG